MSQADIVHKFTIKTGNLQLYIKSRTCLHEVVWDNFILRLPYTQTDR